jgi:hypothetical protein
MARGLYDAASSSSSRVLVEIRGGTHYFENQPDLLAEALDALAAWAEHV